MERALKKLQLLQILFILLVSILSIANVLAELSVGVKEGDWIEYSLSYTGSPSDSYPIWIRIDITDVQGTTITADLKVERIDGSAYTKSVAFNLETGVPDLLLIPAGLDIGDEFYHEDYGYNTITGTEDCIYAGAIRTIVGSTIENIVLHWDKSTGILLHSDYAEDDFTQKLLVDETNIWEQQIFGLDAPLFYILIVAILMIVVIVAVFLLRRR